MRLLSLGDRSDTDMGALLRQLGVSLTVGEAREVCRLLGREPTLTELFIFNTQWSEHCSYKSSRTHLGRLPTAAPWVIQGPQEDAGIVELCTWEGHRWGIVFGHESHNHPSQVVPYEGAATGIGGIIRDVLCMGARVIALADALRFGNPNGAHAATVRYIADGVVSGVAGYGNAVGVPNIAGDVYWDAGYDGNCLVNVVCLGLVRADQIVHSRIPAGAIGWDVVLVGKATDYSGFGGAAFSSGILGDGDEEAQKGAVQVPDPFLKSVIIRGTEAVFAEVRRQQLEVGFKDLGAGGICCTSSEMGDAAGIGVEVALDAVHVALLELPPQVIACAETQERMLWVVPPAFTPTLLAIYNEQFDLPGAAEAAQARVVGRTRADDRYVLTAGGETVCDAPIAAVCRGIRYERVAVPLSLPPSADPPPPLPNFNDVALRVLAHPSVASKASIYSRYDQEVQGNTVLRPGEADAGVLAPIAGCPAGVALSTDCAPSYCRIDPYHGAAMAVAEAVRNVAATGATPRALTDCLNMGDPSDPAAFWAFTESVRGIGDAARALGPQGEDGPPIPFVSGNVSFYNQTGSGRAIPPSPIIACVGVLEDHTKALGIQVTTPGAVLLLFGQRSACFGGSAYEAVRDTASGALPPLNLAAERCANAAVIALAEQRLLLAAHDISDGGLVACVMEMLVGGRGEGRLGAKLDLTAIAERADAALFCEGGGFVVAAVPELLPAIKLVLRAQRVDSIEIGNTGGERLQAQFGQTVVLDVDVRELASAWLGAVPAVMA
ncbi:MAG: phosphoribosylformylglycinamidine synthase subunit PurL [Chloroflexota bacterium]